MHRLIYRLALGAALGLFVMPATFLHAAEPPVFAARPRVDTVLVRLTAEALAANPSLQRDQAMARAAAARIRPAGALPDPMLEAGVMNFVLPDFALRRSDFTEIQVGVSQEFPWPGTLGARTRAARAEARARTADAATRRRDVITRTATLYYQLRYVVAARATLARQRKLLNTAVEISTVRYATTSAPQSDPLQARVALARLDTEEAELAADEARVRADLAALRNAPGSDSVVVAPIEPGAVATTLRHAPGLHPFAETGELDEVMTVASESLAFHPRVQARQAAVEAAEQTVRVEALGARPDFTISTRYGARPIASDFFSAFVGVRIPLYAGRKQHRLADAARAESEAARADVDAEREALAAELRTALAEVRSGAVRLRLLVDKVVPAAAATVEASVRSYRVGHVEFLNVLATEDALYRAELDAARVAAEHLAHLVMLEQLVSREEPS